MPLPRTCAEAEEQLGDSVAIYLDGGPVLSAESSTIVDVTGTVPRVLREGAVSIQALRRVSGPRGRRGPSPVEWTSVDRGSGHEPVPTRHLAAATGGNPRPTGKVQDVADFHETAVRPHQTRNVRARFGGLPLLVTVLDGEQPTRPNNVAATSISGLTTRIPSGPPYRAMLGRNP